MGIDSFLNRHSINRLLQTINRLPYHPNVQKESNKKEKATIFQNHLILRSSLIVCVCVGEEKLHGYCRVNVHENTNDLQVH